MAVAKIPYFIVMPELALIFSAVTPPGYNILPSDEEVRGYWKWKLLTEPRITRDKNGKKYKINPSEYGLPHYRIGHDGKVIYE